MGMWTYIYFIIFEKMELANNPFYQQSYYILIPVPAPCLLTLAPSCPPPPTSPHLNAEDKAQGQNGLLVSRQDLLEQGYEQSKKAWTEEEDQLLLRLCSHEDARYEQVARLIPGRNAKMCYSRFRRLTNQSKESWSREENSKLQRLVEEAGSPCWKTLALNFPNRNHKQLKDHYENYLRPDLAPGEWTIEEDLRLVGLVDLHGLDWKALTAGLPHRSRNQIKNRLFGRILRIHTRNRVRARLG